MGLTKPRASQIYNLDYKQATRVVTTTNITLSGGAPSQVDGVSLTADDRILVTGQSTASQNGLYDVVTVGSGSDGTWIRTSDANSTGEIDSGMIVMVTEGLIYADTQWKLITDNPITIGSTALVFTQNYSANSISGGTSNVTVYSNSNVTISSAGTSNVVSVGTAAVTFAGNLFPSANVAYSLGNTALRWKDIWLANSTIYLGNVSLAADATQLTVNGANVVTSTGDSLSTAGNIIGGNILTSGSISATGNITGNYILGNGSQLTGLPATYSNTNVSSFLAAFGSNTISTTGSITSGNITGGNLLTGGLISSAGNITGGNVNTAGVISTTGNIYTGNILTNGYYYANGVAFGGSGGTPGGANTYIQFNDSATFNGTAGFTFNKTTNAVGTTGTVSATGNITGGNVLTAGQLISTLADGTAPFVITSTTKVINLNVELVDGYHAQTVTAANTIAVRDASQNIAAVGFNGTSVSVSGAVTGGSLSVGTGNITGGNLILSGAIQDTGQLDIQTTAGNGNIVLTPNGTGNVNTGANISATGRVTAASVVGGVMTGSSVSVTGAVTAASVVGGVMTGSSVSVTGAVTGASVVGGVMTGTSLSVSGNVTAAGHVGTMYTNSIINTGANATGNIGSSTLYFNTAFVKATSAQYADLAEMYSSDENYVPGTVVEFGGAQEITISSSSHSTQVAGIISTNPSYLMNSAHEGEYVLPVALTGRVPCRVVGIIHKGDRLVASNLPGVAMALDMDYYAPGCIIGKALENYQSTDVGTIEVAVGRF